MADETPTAGEAARDKVVRREDPRSAEERRIDVEPGTVEPSGLTETSADAGKSTDELRKEVEEAREDLADTVTELGQKVDPRPKVEAAGRQAKRVGPPVGAAVLLAAILAVVIWRKRR